VARSLLLLHEGRVMTHFLQGFLILMALAAILGTVLAICFAAVAGDAQDRGDAMGGRR
jgi:hypothetical protein